MSGGKCLICNCNLPSSTSSAPVQQSDLESFQSVNFVDENNRSNVSSSSLPSSSLINQHVHTIFILNTIFQLPSTRLTKYLTNFPTIENWITLCSPCEQVINDCKSVYNDLLKLQQKLLVSRLNIIKLVKTNYTGDSDEDGQFSGKSNQFNVSQDCRRFIFKRKYSEVQDSPFITGDNQALNKLITSLSSVVKQEEELELAVEIKIEEDDVSQISPQIILPNCQDEDDDNWQPQPTSSYSDSPSGSDSDYSIAPPPPSIKSTRQKVIRRKCKPSSKYQCSICHRILSGPFSLRRHVALRHNLGFQKRYPGYTKALQNPQLLTTHKKTPHNKLALHKCRHCEKGFFNRESWKTHEALHKSDPSYLPFPCYLCPASGFTTKSALTLHKAEVHNLPQPESRPMDLNPEATADTPQPTKPYPCTLCPSTFTLRTNLQHHLQQIHKKKVTHQKKSPKGTQPHRCPFCPSKFSFSGNLTRHLQTLHNQEPEKNIECTQCPRKFASHGDLRKHCRMLHKVELEAPPIPTATCETCGLIFKSMDSMKAHQKNSPNCRPFHYKDKPVKPDTTSVCEICGAKFTNKYCMQKHIRHKHENKYEFNCDRCPPGKLKGFHKEHDYKYHLFCKHGEGREEDVKRWLCSEEGCGKRLESENELKWHLDWHKGIKGFKCEECGKGFNRPGYLNIHKRSVHGYKGPKWKCEICKKGYKSEENMKSHLESFHFKKWKTKKVKKDN